LKTLTLSLVAAVSLATVIYGGPSAATANDHIKPAPFGGKTGSIHPAPFKGSTNERSTPIVHTVKGGKVHAF
jgi:hypothetical protein